MSSRAFEHLLLVHRLPTQDLIQGAHQDCAHFDLGDTRVQQHEPRRLPRAEMPDSSPQAFLSLGLHYEAGFSKSVSDPKKSVFEKIKLMFV